MLVGWCRNGDTILLFVVQRTAEMLEMHLMHTVSPNSTTERKCQNRQNAHHCERKVSSSFRSAMIHHSSSLWA